MRQRRLNSTASVITLIVVGAWGHEALALSIDTDSDWKVNWDTTVSYGAAWRATAPDAALYGQSDGARAGLSNGNSGGPGSDAGNLNYRNGDMISSLFKVISDIEVKHDDLGGLLRVKSWYDQAEENNAVPYGNQANGYAANSSLSDHGLQPLQRFKGLQLLDAYVYDSFDVAGKPLQVRLGHQAINWGESMFFQGVNQITPLDIPALRSPGSEIKEALLPVWALDGSLGLGGGVSVEGFYQFAWEPTTVDACGTYWSTVDIGIGTSVGACDKITLHPGATASDLAGGIYAPVYKGKDGRDGGQGGLAVKVPVDLLDTEFGLYGMNINSRTPILSAKTGSWGLTPAAFRSTLNPIVASAAGLNPFGFNVQTASAYWEYPNDIHVFGASAATNLLGWSLGGEFSYIPNLPVQRNGNDMVNALLTGTGPLGSQAISTPALGNLSGYDQLKKKQFQVNGVNTYGGILGASKTTVLGEVAMEWVNVEDVHTPGAIRYGRGFIFGTGSSTGNNTCLNGTNPNHIGCQNSGYVTPFAWGYRLRGELEYPQIFQTAVTFKPSLSIAHDVEGVSADNQLNVGRFQTGLTGRFIYDQRYSLDLQYVTYAEWAKYDPLRDHDFYAVTLSATF